MTATSFSNIFEMGRKAVLVMAICASFAGVPAAHATGIPVVDLSHIAVSSMTSIQQYLNTAQAYISAYNDVLQTARNVTAFSEGDVFLASKEKDELMKFIETGRGLYGAVRKTNEVYDDIKRTFVVSPYTDFEAFLEDFAKRKEQGDKQAKSLYDAATLAEDELLKANERHQRIVQEIPMIEGVTDAALSTTQAVGVLIEQTSGMTQLMAANSRMQGNELQKRYDEKAKIEEAKKKNQRFQKESLEHDKALF